jgi:TolB-like protein
MPVHRIPGGPGQTVFAFTAELAAWLVQPQNDVAGRPQVPRQRAPGLLVLPFEYRGPEGADRAFVGDAISSEVLNRLAVAPLADLRVLSGTTARAYRQSQKRADELATELDVRYLVEGGVDEAGDRWNIDIRVVDALEDRVVLADRFVAKGPEAMRINSTIAEAVSGHLALQLGSRMVEPFWNHPVDPSAFLAYIRSVEAMSRPSLETMRLASSLADEALAIDPGFAPAYVARAAAAAHIYQYFHNGDADEYARVRRLATECFERSPQLATSQMLDARLSAHYDYAWSRADELYGRILAALPSETSARANLAYVQSVSGRLDDAQRTLDVARDLDRSPQLLHFQGGFHVWRREFDDALEYFDRALAVSPRHLFASVSKAGVLGLLLRDEKRARAHVETMGDDLRKLFGPYADACVACASGDRARFDAARQEAAQSAEEGRGLLYHVAMLDAAAGDTDAAIDHLDAAITRGRGETVAHSRVEPVFDSLRADERFHRQLARVNLAA